jgi:histidyl-tRNA synthetase
MRLQAPPGVQDVLPASTPAWRKLEAAFHHHASLYGYNEIRTPTYEYTEVFTRTVGETSDIVSKEMFKVIDSGGRDLSLKPESTAPVMRAVIEHALCPPGTVGRFYYVSSKHFRMERQQKGRLKEHHQVGVELLGVEGPAGDAEVIELGVKFAKVHCDCSITKTPKSAN